jgi:hypothetical protein
VGNKSDYSQLRLDALGHEGVEMLSALLGDGVGLEHIKTGIASVVSFITQGKVQGHQRTI